MPMTVPPLVGIPTDFRYLAGTPFHLVNEKYVTAVAVGIGAVPVLLPAIAETQNVEAILRRVHGLLITGSPSNVQPGHYGNGASAAGTLHDPARDATTLPLIRAAIATGLPLLAICRGHQEMNVALGGTLTEKVHELPGRIDHRARPEDPVEVRYGPAHEIQLAEGGVLAGWMGADRVEVNSVHAQAIDRLAPGLVVEATAEDGTIEAVRSVAGPGFAIGVQWHPEYRFAENKMSRALFAAFAAAVESRAAA